MTAQFKRHAEVERRTVRFSVDGVSVSALEGDTVLTAVLSHGQKLRDLEFTGEPRAGFCLMGACQDCWIWLAEGRRIRACTTFVSEGLNVVTGTPDRPWQNRP
jgi:predicted molibdopterin-dependent oxidoreductase YjgC